MLTLSNCLKRLVPLAVLLVYSIIGAFLFNLFEFSNELNERRWRSQNFTKARNTAVSNINRIVENSKQISRFRDEELYEEILRFHESLGVQEEQGPFKWDLPGAWYYAMTLYTTVGYGNICPNTTEGRALSIGYLLIGIPLTLIALIDLGKLLSSLFVMIWLKLSSCSRRATEQKKLNVEGDAQLIDSVTTQEAENFNVDILNLPISFVLLIAVAWVAGSAALMLVWHRDWTFFSSFYFIMITFSTVGLGDLVPSHRDPLEVLVVTVIILLGIALLSAAFALVQEQLESLYNELRATIEKDYLASQVGGDSVLAMAEDPNEINAELKHMVHRLPWSARFLYTMLPESKKKALRKEYSRRANAKPKAAQTEEKWLVTSAGRENVRQFVAPSGAAQKVRYSPNRKSHDDVESLVEMCDF